MFVLLPRERYRLSVCAARMQQVQAAYFRCDPATGGGGAMGQASPSVMGQGSPTALGAGSNSGVPGGNGPSPVDDVGGGGSGGNSGGNRANAPRLNEAAQAKRQQQVPVLCLSRVPTKLASSRPPLSFAFVARFWHVVSCDLQIVWIIKFQS